MGGIDMGRGLDHAVAYFGVRDVRGLIDRLRVIKGFRLPDERKEKPPTRELLPRSLRQP